MVNRWFTGSMGFGGGFVFCVHLAGVWDGGYLSTACDTCYVSPVHFIAMLLIHEICEMLYLF